MNKAEYEQQVLQKVQRSLADDESLKQRITVEEVRLETSSTPPSMIVILYRDLKRPECLFGWRREAVEPTRPEEEPFIIGPGIHATIVSANFEEYIEGTPYGLPEDRSPDTINWTN